ncbi:MAG: DUF1565 domain-containing protein [Chitinivibrionales bacterium]|nr:DUF1565 domain-containing protein [Chitinivibrionales bacterium]MBD3395217.1 DUF1565 domain-containing protein [Chitinivibrionales bacterium]
MSKRPDFAQSFSQMAIAAGLTVLLLRAMASGLSYHVSPDGSDSNDGSEGSPFLTITRAAGVVQPGDIVYIANGVYRENVPITTSGTESAPIVFIGESTEGVIIDAEGTRRHCIEAYGIDYVHLKKLTARGAICESGQDEAIQIKWLDSIPTGEPDVFEKDTADGWVLEDLLAEDNIGRGIFLIGTRNFVARRIVAQHNFATGFGGSANWNLHISDCICRWNNEGLDYNPYDSEHQQGVVTPDNSNGVGKSMIGKYQLAGSFEAGGGKFLRAKGMLVERHLAYENYGNGMWFDAWNENVVIKDSHFYGNKGVRYNWEGAGLMLELNNVGPIEVNNCYFHDNVGSDFLVAESQNITLVNSLVKGKIELRDMDDRESQDPTLIIAHLRAESNVFQNCNIAGSLDVHDWSKSKIQARDVMFDHNVWQGSTPKVSNINRNTYTGFDAIRNGTGWAMNSTTSSDWDEWSMPDAPVAIRPARPARAASVFAPVRPNALVFDLRGRLISSPEGSGRAFTTGDLRCCAPGVYISRARAMQATRQARF